MSTIIDTYTIDGHIDNIIEALPSTHQSLRIKSQLAELQLELVNWQMKLHELGSDPAVEVE